MSFTVVKPFIPSPRLELHPFTKLVKQLRHCSSSAFGNAGRRHKIQVQKNCVFRVKVLPDWPLMAALIEHIEGQRDLITHKSAWHLSDEAMKFVYTFYNMFTLWGCSFFGSTKDPYYD
ncbi:photosynthetic NDH subunit of subcomplex B 4, chloroplastic-like isoform X2 [Solanum dulcamara]|uniref:photosynthetic NDH subunit of subcomplex B 4, chloroplastic-like isoform X2 n=1 Tax=Solanum dulcamara TaxID=45834 RepID=UPI00248588BE|nr:photosynthetic NDH subunit of subcomplex B 4, chloroplastic-like isoform X2 [Solanum dulcamara]XP_055819245.1 photosynthetic NDH subunit of subcomplex B 4, chloroplastic-like isoform X2 [Solanum dulcamara]